MFLPLLLAAAGLQFAFALELDSSSPQSVRDTAGDIAKGLFASYANGEVGVGGTQASQVGVFPLESWYWWLSGGIWGGMIDYWSYTKDTTYLNRTLDALAAQAGPNFDFMPPAQAASEANDDQAFWVFAALTGLEQNLPPLPCVGAVGQCQNTYLRMAVNVFNEQVQRYRVDSTECGGGLRWQYTPSSVGYDYKNTVSNGGLFNIAARLARYTGNATYAQWAERIWDWEFGVGLIGPAYHIFDGAHTGTNCTDIDHTEWSYNNAIHMQGAAMMYNHTQGSKVWKTRVQGLLDAGTSTFFNPYKNATDVLYEPRCERGLDCSTDSTSFKAYLSRTWAKTTVLAPFTAKQIMPLLKASAVAAARNCDASNCGMGWWREGYVGTSGIGQQLSALETVQALLIASAPAPRKSAAAQWLTSLKSYPGNGNSDST